MVAYAMSKRNRTEGRLDTTDAAIAELVGSTPAAIRSVRRRLITAGLISTGQHGRRASRWTLTDWPDTMRDSANGSISSPPLRPPTEGDSSPPLQGGDRSAVSMRDMLPFKDFGAVEGGDDGAIAESHRHPDNEDHRHPCGHPPPSNTRAYKREREKGIPTVSPSADADAPTVVELYNRTVSAVCPRWSRATFPPTTSTRKAVAARIANGANLSTFKAVFAAIAASDFLREKKRGACSIAWALGPKNFDEVADGKYRNQGSVGGGGGFDELQRWREGK